MTEPFQPSLDAWLATVQETGSAYLRIEIDTDIAALIDEAREHLHVDLGIPPTEVVVRIVGSNALLLTVTSHTEPDPFAD